MSEIISEEKRKRGRPKSGEVVRDSDLHLRMTLDEMETLDRLSRITGKSKSDFIRDIIRAERDRIDQERSKKFAYLSQGSDKDYGYFDEYETDFDDDID